jgi:hypothetical protein
MENTEKVYIGADVDPNAKIEITRSEFLAIKEFITPFQMMVALFNNLEQGMFAKGIIKPFTKDDLDEEGRLLEGFWSKEESKEKTKKAKPVDKDLLK